MDFCETFEKTDFKLAEVAVIEVLRRAGVAELHPRLENALLIYDDVGQAALTGVYRDYVFIAESAEVPILICTPTWRANPERISAASIGRDVNGDAVDDWGDRIILLNRRHGIKILGGCCGTGPAHLDYLIPRYRESS